MEKSTIKALKEQRGLTVFHSAEHKIKVGKMNYIVKSVFTGNSNKTLDQSILDLAEKKALHIVFYPN